MHNTNTDVMNSLIRVSAFTKTLVREKVKVGIKHECHQKTKFKSKVTIHITHED